MNNERNLNLSVDLADKSKAYRQVYLIKKLNSLLDHNKFNVKKNRLKIKAVLKNPDFDMNCFKDKNNLNLIILLAAEKEKFDVLIKHGFNLFQEYSTHASFLPTHRAKGNLLLYAKEMPISDNSFKHKPPFIGKNSSEQLAHKNKAFYQILTNYPELAFAPVEYASKTEKNNTCSALSFLFLVSNQKEILNYLDFIQKSPVYSNYVRNSPDFHKKLFSQLFQISHPHIQTLEYESNLLSALQKFESILKKPLKFDFDPTLFKEYEETGYIHEIISHHLEILSLLVQHNILNINPEQVKLMKSFFTNLIKEHFLEIKTQTSVDILDGLGSSSYGLKKTFELLEKLEPIFGSPTCTKWYYIMQNKIDNNQHLNKFLKGTLLEPSFLSSIPLSYNLSKLKKIKFEWELGILNLNRILNSPVAQEKAKIKVL